MAKNDPTVGEALIVRYELIECLIAQGMHKRHVVQYVRDHEAELQWDISDRQVRNYFDTVQERIKQGVMRHRGAVDYHGLECESLASFLVNKLEHLFLEDEDA